MKRNSKHFIKAHNITAALYILNIVTTKTTTMNNDQCHREVSFLRSQQLLIYS